MKRLVSALVVASIGIAMGVPLSVARAEESASWPGATQIASAGEFASSAVDTNAGLLVSGIGGSYPNYTANVRLVTDPGWTNLNSSGKVSSAAPSLAVDSAGVPWAMWHEQDSGNPNTAQYMISSQSDQGGWSTPVSVSGVTSTASPSFAVLAGKQGSLVAAWGKFAGGGGENPAVRRWIGSTWSDPIVATASLSRMFFRMLDDGTVVALGSSNVAGTPTFTAVTLAPSAETWSDPYLMPDGTVAYYDGNNHWVDGTVVGDAVYVMFADAPRSLVRFSGGTFVRERVIKEVGGEADNPVLVNAGGELLAVWMRYDNEGYPLIWSRRAASGQWSTDAIVPGTLTWDYKSYPTASADSSGAVALAWKIGGVGLGFSRTVGGSWTSASTLPGTGTVWSVQQSIPTALGTWSLLANAQVGGGYPGYVVTMAAPVSPSQVQVSGGRRAVDVSWQAGDDSATSYTATAHATDSDEAVLGSCTVAAPALSCSIASLNDNAVYYVAVVASNVYGDSAAPARVSALTEPATPVLTKSTVTSTSVSFTYESEGGVTYSAAARRGSTDLPQSQVVMTTVSGAPTVKVTGLAPGTSVTVQVTATNATGSVVSDPTPAKSATTKPATVRGLEAGKLKNAKVTLTWTAVAATGESVVYRVRWAKKGTKDWSAWTQVTTTRAVATGWAKGTQYTVQVFARNAKGDSPSVTSGTFTAS